MAYPTHLTGRFPVNVTRERSQRSNGPLSSKEFRYNLVREDLFSYMYFKVWMLDPILL